MIEKYPIYVVQNRDVIEQLGSKEKFWFYDHDEGNVKLFKIGRPGTGENWAEKAACEFAKLLDLPCAEYDFAIWDTKEGVVSPSFVPAHSRLIHGNEFLAKIVNDYPSKKTYKAREYKLFTVIALIQLLKSCSLPLGFTGNESVKTPLDVYVGYLLFDCLISNTDRHHENWGFLFDTLDKSISLAPTYDHASGFGCRVSPDKIIERLHTKNERFTVKAFVNKAKSAFYGKEMNLLLTIDAFMLAARHSPSVAYYWLWKIHSMSLEKIEEIFLKIPDHLITRESLRFAVEVIISNRSRLLSQRGEVEKWLR